MKSIKKIAAIAAAALLAGALAFSALGCNGGSKENAAKDGSSVIDPTDDRAASTVAPNGSNTNGRKSNDSRRTQNPGGSSDARSVDHSWRSLGDAELVTVEYMDNEKNLTAKELSELTAGTLVAFNENSLAARGGADETFSGVFVKGLLGAVSGGESLDEVASVTLIGMDGSETVIRDELADANLHESVLAFQSASGVFVTDSGCTLVLKSTVEGQPNKLFTGIKSIVFESSDVRG